MRAHQLDANGVIINTIVVDSLDVIPGLVDASIGGQIGDKIVGGVVVPQVVFPTEAEYTVGVQSMLDTKAQERNYDGILSACTYATSTNAKFKAEGQACSDWRDAVWAKCYDVLGQVKAGTLTQPTMSELLAMLPQLVWPT